MSEDWRNFRIIWNREAERITQEALGRALGIGKSYVSGLGNGKKRFNEDLLEGFATHMGLPLSVLFSEDAAGVPLKEAEIMKKIKEMIQVMLVHPDIQTILLGEFTKLKLIRRDEISKKNHRIFYAEF